MPTSPPPSSTRRIGSAPPRGGPGGTANRPLYAIDFTAVACGKRIANTKRRVRWRFGFANPDALAAGETGTACRGEEHDVTFVWSVTSGKRLILADGQEVHYSSSRSAVIDFSWTMKGNHVLKVIAHATVPMTVDNPFRQYDFFVDGRSFFTFPKVYRLGLTPGKTVSPDGSGNAAPRGSGGGRAGMAERGERRSNHNNIAQIEAPANPDEEEAYLREAIKASLMEQQQNEASKPKISAEAADLLIDFMDDWDASKNDATALVSAPGQNNQWAAPPTDPYQLTNQWGAPPATATIPSNNQWGAAPTQQPDNGWAMAPPQPPASMAQQQPGYGGGYGGGASVAPQPDYGAGGYGSEASVAAPSNPFAPPSAQQQQYPGFAAPAPSNDVFGFAAPPSTSYGQPPAPTDPNGFTASLIYGQPAPAAPSDPWSTHPVTNDTAPMTNNGGPVLTMGSLDATGGLLAGTSDKSAPLAAGGGGGGGGGGGTMAEKALQNLMGSINSFGLTGKPATANNPFDTNNIMSNATLGEIKNTKPVEKKPVMNPGPGAMVITNNQGGNWGGFGAGGGQQQTQQYGMSTGYPQQGGMGMHLPMMGMMQPQQMGMQQQGMMQGQSQGYGAPTSYGHQPPMQPQGYGAPASYGQQPPMQQQQQSQQQQQNPWAF